MSELFADNDHGRDIDPYMQAFPWVDRVVSLKYQQEVRGIEHIPALGPGILVGNHLRAADSFLIPASVVREAGRRVIFAAKQEYFEGEMNILGQTHRTPTAWFFQEFTHAIPVARDGNKESINAFHSAAVQVLNNGDLLAGYPEGTRSPDGRLYRFRNGLANIALSTGAPIIPHGIRYDWPAGFDPRVHATMEFGPPITVEEYGDLRPYQLSDLMRERVQSITGQDYVHQYAPTGKEEKRKFIIDLKRRAK